MEGFSPMQVINDNAASNGDEKLFVQFFKSPVMMEHKSEQEGRPIYEERLFIRIIVPGDNTNVVEREAWDGDKARFPRQWKHFEAMGDSAAVEGTAIEHWPAMNRAQVEEFKALRFYTVESIANASDSQLQRLGMGGMGFRAKAQAYLAAAKDTALVQHQAAELERRDSENAELKRQIAEQGRQIAELAAKVDSPRKRQAEAA